MKYEQHRKDDIQSYHNNQNQDYHHTHGFKGEDVYAQDIRYGVNNRYNDQLGNEYNCEESQYQHKEAPNIDMGEYGYNDNVVDYHVEDEFTTCNAPTITTTSASYEVHVETSQHQDQYEYSRQGSKDYTTPPGARDNQNIDLHRSSTRSHRRQQSIDAKSHSSIPAYDGGSSGSGVYLEERSPRSSRHYTDQVGNTTLYPEARLDPHDSGRSGVSHKKAPLSMTGPDRMNPILRVQHPSGSINEEPVSPTIDVYRPPQPHHHHAPITRQASAEDATSSVAQINVEYQSPRPRTAIGHHGPHTLPRGAAPPRAHHHTTPLPFDNQFCDEQHRSSVYDQHGMHSTGSGHQTSVTVLHEDVYPTTVEREPPFVDIYATHPPQYLRKQYDNSSGNTHQASFHKGKLLFLLLKLNLPSLS